MTSNDGVYRAMKIHSTHKAILAYLADHESITVTQAAHLLYGDKVTRPQITSARRTLNNMAAAGILFREIQDGKAVFVWLNHPEREAIKNRITWLFSDEGQQWLLEHSPGLARQPLAIYELRVFLGNNGIYDSDNDLELRRMLAELVDAGRLITGSDRKENTANGRTYQAITWKAPDFNPTPEQIAEQQAREEEHRKEVAEAFARGWLMAR